MFAAIRAVGNFAVAIRCRVIYLTHGQTRVQHLAALKQCVMRIPQWYDESLTQSIIPCPSNAPGGVWASFIVFVSRVPCNITTHIGFIYLVIALASLVTRPQSVRKNGSHNT